MTPWLPIPTATKAICKAVAVTFCCPKAEYACIGALLVSWPIVGKFDTPAPGMSIGIC